MVPGVFDNTDDKSISVFKKWDNDNIVSYGIWRMKGEKLYNLPADLNDPRFGKEFMLR